MLRISDCTDTRQRDEVMQRQMLLTRVSSAVQIQRPDVLNVLSFWDALTLPYASWCMEGCFLALRWMELQIKVVSKMYNRMNKLIYLHLAIMLIKLVL